MKNPYRYKKNQSTLDYIIKSTILPGYNLNQFCQLSKDKEHPFSKKSKRYVICQGLKMEFGKYMGISLTAYCVYNLINL